MVLNLFKNFIETRFLSKRRFIESCIQLPLIGVKMTSTYINGELHRGGHWRQFASLKDLIPNRQEESFRKKLKIIFQTHPVFDWLEEEIFCE